MKNMLAKIAIQKKICAVLEIGESVPKLITMLPELTLQLELNIMVQVTQDAIYNVANLSLIQRSYPIDKSLT